MTAFSLEKVAHRVKAEILQEEHSELLALHQQRLKEIKEYVAKTNQDCEIIETLPKIDLVTKQVMPGDVKVIKKKNSEQLGHISQNEKKN